MHIVCDKAINVAALTAAINPLFRADILDKWGQGCVELYQQIGDWADIVTEVEQKVSDLLQAGDAGFPGVFAYEVTESVGKYLQRAILSGSEAALTDGAVYAITVAYSIDFCKLSPDVMTALVAPRA